MISELLALAALAIGVWHVIELQGNVSRIQNVQARLSREIKQTDAQILKVSGTLSTRYIGKFPEFLPAIAALAKTAQKSLIVACDLPGYGAFSSPRNAHLYQNAVDAHNGQTDFTMEFTFMDRERRADYLDEQFADPAWDKWQADKDKAAKILAYVSANRLPSGAITDRKSLMDELKQRNEAILNSVLYRDAIQTTDPMPLYFWIKDNEEAIFAIPALSKDAIEYGFETKDPELIAGFRDLRLRYRKRAMVERK